MQPSLAPRSRVTHFHFCGGSGLMALGMQEAHARVGTLEAEMECLGGFDADPGACADFKRLVGVHETCRDLFTVEQFRAFHGACRTAKKRCARCQNTGEPPAGWREVTVEDVRQAAQGRVPDIVCTSSPCKGLSGLLSPGLAESARYQALNGLTVRCVRLMCEAWGDDPPPLFVFENVPLIATRGRGLLDEIKELLDDHGYAAAETFHDCGELGGLAQRRRRFLLVARHRRTVHAYARGTLVELPVAALGGGRLHYNPYEAGVFVVGGEPIAVADRVDFRRDGAYVVQGAA